MIDNKCHCKRCRKEKRKGRILGSRHMTFWTDRWNGVVELYSGQVSDYVPYHRYQKRRRPDPKIDHFM